jgi:hypothetical protein
MTDYNPLEVWCPRTHHQKLLTVRWRSFSWWGREGIAICFANKGSQKFLYNWLQHIGGVIAQGALLQIVDALLTHMFMMGKGEYCYLFTYNGSQKFLSDWLQPIRGVISQDTWPKIIDTSLTLSFMMGQGGYCSLFCLSWRPKMPFGLITSYRRCDFPGRMTKNCWHSVNAHFGMAVSPICNHSIWHSPSFALFWLHFWLFHLLSSWSLRCTLIIHRYI